MSAILAHKLKGHQVQLAKARASAEVSRAALLSAERVHKSAESEVVAIERRIAELQRASADPIVSEHALLRWIERVEKHDIDAVRVRMLSPAVVEAIRFAGSGKVRHDGVMIIFKNNTIVTVE